MSASEAAWIKLERESNHEHGEGRVMALAGYFGVIANLLAVALLWDMPSAYRVARLSEWVRAVGEQPVATAISSLSFTLGLVAIAVWALAFAARLVSPLARAGAGLVAVGALINAAGTLAPMVQAYHVGACGEACDAVGRGLLGLTLTFDALFNLMLGFGLILVAFESELSAGMRRLVGVAGVAALPVAGQAIWDSAANWLIVAAPLWIAVILLTSTRAIRSHG